MCVLTDRTLALTGRGETPSVWIKSGLLVTVREEAEMGWLRNLLHRDESTENGSERDAGVQLPTIPSPQYGMTRGPGAFMPDMSGFASSRGNGRHIVPGSQEPDHPERR